MRVGVAAAAADRHLRGDPCRDKPITIVVTLAKISTSPSLSPPSSFSPLSVTVLNKKHHHMGCKVSVGEYKGRRMEKFGGCREGFVIVPPSFADSGETHHAPPMCTS